MQEYVVVLQDSIVRHLKSSSASIIILAIIDIFMLDIFYPGLIQLLSHWFLFIWITVPMIFWHEPINKLFTFKSWCKSVQKHLKRYYSILAFIIDEEISSSESQTKDQEFKQPITSSQASQPSKETQDTSSITDPTKEPATGRIEKKQNLPTPSTRKKESNGFFSSFRSVFSPSAEEKQGLSMSQCLLDICKLIVFLNQSIPVYAIILGLECHIFPYSFIAYLLTIFILQFGISIGLSKIFNVTEITQLYNPENFSLLPMFLLVVYLIIHYASKSFNGIFHRKKRSYF